MSMESLRKARSHYSMGEGIPQLKVGAGETAKIRILPGNYGPDKDLFCVGLAQHWMPNHKGAVFCRNLHLKSDEEVQGECPICELREELRVEERELAEREKKGEDLKAERKLVERMIKDTYTTFRFLMFVLDRSDNTVKKYYAPKTVSDVIFNSVEQNSFEIIDPENGNDFTIKREDKNNRTSYDVSTLVKSTPLADTSDAIEDILDKTRKHSLEDDVKLMERGDVQAICDKLRDFRAGGGGETDVDRQSSQASGVFDEKEDGEEKKFSETSAGDAERGSSSTPPKDLTDDEDDAAAFASASDGDDGPAPHPDDEIEEPPAIDPPAEDAPAAASAEGKKLLGGLANAGD